MTRSRLLAGVAVLLLGIACGRLGAPVRTPNARGAGGTPPALPGIEAPQGKDAERPRSEPQASEVRDPASPAEEEEVEKR